MAGAAGDFAWQPVVNNTTIMIPINMGRLINLLGINYRSGLISGPLRQDKHQK
jgi:hypothetical protein